MHFGLADPYDCPKCGQLESVIFVSGGLRSRYPLIKLERAPALNLQPEDPKSGALSVGPNGHGSLNELEYVNIDNHLAALQVHLRSGLACLLGAVSLTGIPSSRRG